MALSRDELNSVSVPFYKKAITQQIYDSNILLDKLRSKGHVKMAAHGLSVRFPIRYKELGQSKMVDPDEARATVKVETRTSAQFDWRYAITDIIVNWEERVKNAGEQQMVSLMKDKAIEGQESMDKLFSDQVYQTFANIGSNDLDSLFAICQDPSSSTTYGGISSADASSWVAGLYDTTTSTLALYGTGSMEAGVRACWFDGVPDLIITTKTNAGIYSSKLQPGERRQPQTGKAGAKTWGTDLYFMGIPIIADPQCPANHVWFINTNNLWLFTCPEFDFTLGEWEDDPDRYNALRALISFSGNLAADRRKSFGVYTAIAS